MLELFFGGHVDLLSFVLAVGDEESVPAVFLDGFLNVVTRVCVEVIACERGVVDFRDVS